MKIKILFIDPFSIDYFVEREKGHYNNIRETALFTPEEVDSLSKDELCTLGWTRSIKPLAIRVFEAIEPLDEADTPIDFKIVPSREVSVDSFVPETAFVGTETNATKISKDQYGNSTYSNVPIDTSTLGPVEVLGKTVTIIPFPTPEPTLEDYLLDLDFRMSKIELGV